MQGDDWQIGAVAIVLSSMLGGCSLVSYYAILVDISTEEERDRVSSRGWAWGYLGGGLLLLVNLVMFLGHDALGLSQGLAVRLSLLSAALWWAGVHADPGAPAAQLRAAARARRARRPAAAQLRPAVHHAAGDARATR